MKENVVNNSAEELILRIRKNQKKRIYFRRRVCIALIIISLLSLLITSVYAIDSNSRKQTEYKTVIVESGDTLWSIASDNCGNGDVRTKIREIKKINNIIENTIKIGDILTIPVK